MRFENATIIDMSSEAYRKAKRLGEKACREAAAGKENPYLPSLDAMGIHTVSTEHVGITEIPLALVVGTKTVSRQNAFSVNYMPLLEANSEFAHKWANVYAYQEENGISEPIVVYEYMHHFYVQEGNKRVSVLKYLGAPSIEADVTRIMPTDFTGEAGQRYQEFLQFFHVCPVYEIIFSHIGDYREFAEFLGQSFNEKWPLETVHLAEAVYYRFYRVFQQIGGDAFTRITSGDALLVYLRIYSPASVMDDPRALLEGRVRKLWPAFTQMDNADTMTMTIQTDPISLQKADLFGFLRPGYSPSRPLKAAFLYDGKNDRVQEEGRLLLQETYKEAVLSWAYPGCAREEQVQIALRQALEQDAEVLFTTSKTMYKAAAQAAMVYPHATVLNASLMPFPACLRTYACRLYEGMFLMGALAAMQSDAIGYAESITGYGEAANVNAFTLGAQYVNPHAQVWLSRREAIVLQAKENGFCLTNSAGERIGSIALSMDWGQYDRLLTALFLDGRNVGESKAVQYWYGMRSGVVKLHAEKTWLKSVDDLYQKALAGKLKPFGEMDDAQIVRMRELVSGVGVK